ncbi:IucA/IucC family protein [Xylanimonas cellulosilytica DSM 15894]|uniref:Lysine N-acyltransferase MbtK n=1 Tax=Xylanimonas cellulosilytica (strain DSM 15894 / JCM 12276 / CECT 5975 / KCTC 9989 / LMG 20990 / NBRC 107835 / XIL07) TaxID=446471 RepID=D1BSX9_XYLCX|nr:GNAT family N-acetyltransferase [Xylanimonas cellulosilytica]ACZ30821.1 IucA/IucC family protein [Xylanimonas cellulosilytica DSM 15894]
MTPLTIEPLDPARDTPAVHAWLTHPRARFWGMTDADPTQVRAYLDAVVADPHQDGWLGRADGTPAFYVETYDPAHLLPAGTYDAQPGDLGMHLLVAPPGAAPVPGFTSAVMAAVMRFCLGDDGDNDGDGDGAGPGERGAPRGLGAARVVVEPDVRNTAILAKNAAAGFRVLHEIDLVADGHTKRAALSVATRTDHATSPLGTGWTGGHDPHPHLRPDHAAHAHRHLVAKAIAELTHERLLAPAPDGRDRYVLDAGPSRYTFTATVLPLDHWVIDLPSLHRTRAGRPTDLDVLDLILELQPTLAIPDDLVSLYLEELASTLAAATAKRHRALAGGPTASDLLHATFQETEAAMTEGHPGFLANNGRIGFSLPDYQAYAPENQPRVRLTWVAARREHTHLALAAHLDEPTHLAQALSPDEHTAFTRRLTDRGLDPADYHLLPLHPWQAAHRLPVTFAADVARGDLVPLGPGGDEHQPQQSIRTLYNLTRPHAPYVKVALAIQNMGFLRGLSPAYMRDTPAINDWVAHLVHTDPTLTDTGFTVLREHATLGYTGDAYHRTAATNPHRKMLAALWRENPVPRTNPGDRLATMAALLHRDHHGHAHATALVRASGLHPHDWLRSYLRAYLRPLVHCLLAHDLVFMPHGENLVLTLRDHVVVSTFIKDIGEEVAVLGPRALPPTLERIRGITPGREKALAIFTDVFDGVLRHLAGILDTDGVLPATQFWGLVAETLDTYEADHPDLARGLAGDIDLRAPTFAHSCLNRLQLRNTLQMVDLTDQSASLLYAGDMPNPVARTRVPVP